MSVVVPPIYTEIDDKELSLNRPTSEETVRKLVQNVNLLGTLAPVGLIVGVAVNTPGVPPVNSLLFQFCDGSQITDPTSPIRATLGHPRATPRINDKYLRGAPDTTSNPDSGDLDVGGFATRDLNHNHGGATGFVCVGIVGEEGDERHGYEDLCHQHTISSDLSDEDPIDMAHVQTAFYLKIN